MRAICRSGPASPPRGGTLTSARRPRALVVCSASALIRSGRGTLGRKAVAAGRRVAHMRVANGGATGLPRMAGGSICARMIGTRIGPLRLVARRHIACAWSAGGKTHPARGAAFVVHRASSRAVNALMVLHVAAAPERFYVLFEPRVSCESDLLLIGTYSELFNSILIYSALLQGVAPPTARPENAPVRLPCTAFGRILHRGTRAAILFCS